MAGIGRITQPHIVEPLVDATVDALPPRERLGHISIHKAGAARCRLERLRPVIAARVRRRRRGRDNRSNTHASVARRGRRHQWLRQQMAWCWGSIGWRRRGGLCLIGWRGLVSRAWRAENTHARGCGCVCIKAMASQLPTSTETTVLESSRRGVGEARREWDSRTFARGIGTGEVGRVALRLVGRVQDASQAGRELLS
jgi:hypothetical protein